MQDFPIGMCPAGLASAISTFCVTINIDVRGLPVLASGVVNRDVREEEGMLGNVSIYFQ